MSQPRIPLYERFSAKVDRRGADECWEWTAGLRGGGYGQIKADSPSRAMLLAHRVAYEIANGPIPDGLCVLHSCDNPPCCNPAHLRLGTLAENTREMVQKGRARSSCLSGSAHPRARFTEAQVAMVRSRRAKGESMASLAREFDVAHSTIRRMVLGLSWR